MSFAFSDSGEIIETMSTKTSIHADWNISNIFRHLDAGRDCYRSPRIAFMDKPWYLTLWPSGTGENERWVEINLLRFHFDSTKRVHVTIGLRKDSGRNLVLVYDEVFPSDSLSWSPKKLMLKSCLLRNASRFAPSDVLTITFSLRSVDELFAKGWCRSRNDFVNNFENMVNHPCSKAIGLYVAGDEYDFRELKEQCVELLATSLSTTTIGDVIAFAQKHKEGELLECATQFFRENVKEILSTYEWLCFVKSNPEAASEIFLKAYKDCHPEKVAICTECQFHALH